MDFPQSRRLTAFESPTRRYSRIGIVFANGRRYIGTDAQAVLARLQAGGWTDDEWARTVGHLIRPSGSSRPSA